MIYPDSLSPVTQYLKECAIESAQRSYTTLCYKHTPLSAHDYWPGVFSITYPRIRQRYIFGDTAVAFGAQPTGKDWWLEFPRREAWPYDTPTRCARNYISKYYTPPKWTHAQNEALADSKMPKAWYPQTLDSAVYIDIRGAWRRIMMVAGWDVHYWPGKFFAPGRPPEDYPLLSEKLCYPMLVSCASTHRARYHRAGFGTQFINTYNKIYNRQILGVCADVLGAVALDCLALGAIYWNTDGAICDEKDAYYIAQAIQSWGFDCRVKRGPEKCHIYAGGYYFYDGLQQVRLNHGGDKPLAPAWEDRRKWFYPRWQWALSHQG